MYSFWLPVILRFFKERDHVSSLIAECKKIASFMQQYRGFTDITLRFSLPWKFFACGHEQFFFQSRQGELGPRWQFRSSKLKLCGQDSDPKTKSCDGNCIPKKRKRKGTFCKYLYEYSASFYEGNSSLEKVDSVTYKSPLSLNTQDEPQIVAKSQ